jgi:MFS family permease
MKQADASGTREEMSVKPYAWYVLGVLFLVYVINVIDRQILSILAQDIKVSIGVSDAQIGFLYGTAFAVFYALFGIALGWLADRWNRCRLIALGLSLWSSMTALSGLASSFGYLALARVGVGIGEASASPSAFSLLADYFPRERRALALSIYSAGMLVGLSLSLPAGGTIASAWTAHFPAGDAPFGLVGWQVAFIAVGIPGLLLAAWVMTLREPVRGLADGVPVVAEPGDVWRGFGREVSAIIPPFTLWSAAERPGGLRSNVMLLITIAAVACILMWLTGDRLQWGTMAVGIYAAGSWLQRLRAMDRPTFALLFGTPAILLALLSVGCLAFVGYAIAFWVPPYAIRTYHIGTDVAGWKLGFTGGLGAAAGCILGGRLSDAWKSRSPSGRIYVCMLSIGLPPPIVYSALTADTADTVYILYPVALTFASLWTGSAAAMIQDCVLPRMRGVAAAAYLLASALLGLALSPYLVGKISASTGSLRIGVLSMFTVVPVALIVMWRASRGLPAAEQTKATRARHAETALPDLAAAHVSRGDSSSADT